MITGEPGYQILLPEILARDSYIISGLVKGEMFSFFLTIKKETGVKHEFHNLLQRKSMWLQVNGIK